MTRYLLDTNVLSETARPAPQPSVVTWLRSLPALLVPAVGVYELAAGIERLAAGRRRAFLEAWLAELLGSDPEVLPFDRDAALGAATLEADARRRGRPVEQRDLLILAIAKSRGLGVATRNVEHFRGFSIPIYDPFEDAHWR